MPLKFISSFKSSSKHMRKKVVCMFSLIQISGERGDGDLIVEGIEYPDNLDISYDVWSAVFMTQDK